MNIDNQDIENISRILGEELSNSDITQMFLYLSFIDHDIKRGFTNTKWKRLNESISEKCVSTRKARPLFDVIEYVSKPHRYINRQDSWSNLLNNVNSTLIFKGYELKDDGRVHKTKIAQTFTEAQNRLKSLKEEIGTLNLHDNVTKYCTEELLNEDYFHAVFEACKGLFDRIRELSGLNLDGYPLIDKAFNIDKKPFQPKIFIKGNNLSNQDEKNQYYGLISSIKTCLYLYRNHQAHIPKIYDKLSLKDAMRGLISVSLAHELLDRCVSINDL